MSNTLGALQTPSKFRQGQYFNIDKTKCGGQEVRHGRHDFIADTSRFVASLFLSILRPALQNKIASGRRIGRLMKRVGLSNKPGEKLIATIDFKHNMAIVSTLRKRQILASQPDRVDVGHYEPW